MQGWPLKKVLKIKVNLGNDKKSAILCHNWQLFVQNLAQKFYWRWFRKENMDQIFLQG